MKTFDSKNSNDAESERGWGHTHTHLHYVGIDFIDGVCNFLCLMLCTMCVCVCVFMGFYVNKIEESCVCDGG